MSAVMTDALLSEYRRLVARLDRHDEEAVLAALVRDADWTEAGAGEVLRLARTYGASVLRNALALASALQIEDGEAGL